MPAAPAKIVHAVADDYRFHDPFVGVFTKRSLSQYFEILKSGADYAAGFRVLSSRSMTLSLTLIACSARQSK